MQVAGAAIVLSFHCNAIKTLRNDSKTTSCCDHLYVGGDPKIAIKRVSRLLVLTAQPAVGITVKCEQAKLILNHHDVSPSGTRFSTPDRNNENAT